MIKAKLMTYHQHSAPRPENQAHHLTEAQTPATGAAMRGYITPEESLNSSSCWSQDRLAASLQAIDDKHPNSSNP